MENILEDFYINLEETRNKFESYKTTTANLTSSQVIDCHASLDAIYRILLSLQDAVPMDSDHVYVTMADHCRLKAKELSTDIMNLLIDTDKKKNQSKDPVDDGMECQQAIAQIMEITIRLTLDCIFASPHLQDHHNADSNPHSNLDFAKRYAEYQRILLRKRSKPSIAALANIRKLATSQSIPILDYIESTLEQQHYDHDDEDDHGDGGGNGAEKRPHANAITVILGEASSLIHPLLLWKEGIQHALQHLRHQDASHEHSGEGNLRIRESARINSLETNVQSQLLEMCQQSIQVLHSEAQNLSKTVGEWFLTDTACIDSPLDSNLDEMVFICQVLHRYDEFTSPLQQEDHDGNDHGRSANNAILSQHLTEQILQYTTNETKSISTNIERAIELAQPVQIIMGTDRYVPSVVEDAYYISQRSLDRAAVTMSSKTISMLANWVVEVWSVDGRVYNALMEQRGCCVVVNDHGGVIQDGTSGGRMGKGKKEEGHTKKAPSSGSAFGLLLNAFEKDINHHPNSGENKNSGNGSKSPPPHSGSLDVHRVQIDTQFCLLNGIHAASSACISLSNLFDSLLPEEDDDDDGLEEQQQQQQQQQSKSIMSKEASMIMLAKEQLLSHHNAYESLLRDQIHQFLQEWIGTVTSTSTPPPLIASLPHSPSMHRLFYQISIQQYNLNATTLQRAESDEHIKEFVSPFAESRLMVELRNGKCDDSVRLALIQIMSHEVVTMFFSTLIHQKQRQFSELGYLLLSKQIRTLEEFFCSGVIHQQNGEGGAGGNTSAILKEFQKLAQTVKILECGNPMEWTLYECDVGNTEFDLSKEEIKRVMGLRIDWSQDAIETVCKK